MDAGVPWFLQGFLALAVLPDLGATCKWDVKPECYKQTEEATIYICEWSPLQSVEDVRYHLCFRRSNSTEARSLGPSENNNIKVTDEDVLTKVLVDIWVVAHMQNSSCHSLKSTVKLIGRVKYEPPKISMSRSSGNLTLSWENNKGAAKNVQYRRKGNDLESWGNFETGVNQATLTLEDLQQPYVYELQVRHRSKLATDPLWSDWTPILDVPTEIHNPPKVYWTVKDFNNGSRRLSLTWGTPPYPESAGVVNYNLSLHIWPCQSMQQIFYSNSTQLSVFVTYSAVSGSIVAYNKVGKSPLSPIHVPAKHLTSSSKSWSIDKTGPHNYFKSFKKSCLEWYKLTDGKTRPDKVNKTPIDKPLNEKLQAIMQEMDDFVPYYYLVHNLTKKRWQTTEMRLMYKKEREPRTAPGNVKIDSITSTTATLHWEHIPVSDQRGFLTHYTVCNKMTNQNDRGNTTNECHNISASETKYVIQNLTPRSTYEIRLYGGTSIGSGPAASIGAVTQVQFPGWIIAVLVLIGIIISVCFFYIKRHKSKIFPPIPRPVVVDSTVFLARIQDMYEIKEEVHELQLHNKRSKEPKSEESSLLNVCRTYECDNTDDKSLGDQRSPDYNGQVLQLEALDPSTGETDCEVAMLMYRNGLVFDMNAESTEDVGSPL